MWEEDMDFRRSVRRDVIPDFRNGGEKESIKESVPDFPLVKSEINKEYWHLHNEAMTNAWEKYRREIAANPVRWIAEVDVVRFCREFRRYFRNNETSECELYIKDILSNYIEKYFDLPWEISDSPDDVDDEVIMMIGGLLMALHYELGVRFGMNHNEKTYDCDPDYYTNFEAAVLSGKAWRIVYSLGYGKCLGAYEEMRLQSDGYGGYKII